MLSKIVDYEINIIDFKQFLMSPVGLDLVVLLWLCKILLKLFAADTEKRTSRITPNVYLCPTHLKLSSVLEKKLWGISQKERWPY